MKQLHRQNLDAPMSESFTLPTIELKHDKENFDIWILQTSNTPSPAIARIYTLSIQLLTEIHSCGNKDSVRKKKRNSNIKSNPMAHYKGSS